MAVIYPRASKSRYAKHVLRISPVVSELPTLRLPRVRNRNDDASVFAHVLALNNLLHEQFSEEIGAFNYRGRGQSGNIMK